MCKENGGGIQDEKKASLVTVWNMELGAASVHSQYPRVNNIQRVPASPKDCIATGRTVANIIRFGREVSLVLAPATSQPLRVIRYV